jgi:hypothetical protein
MCMCLLYFFPYSVNDSVALAQCRSSDGAHFLREGCTEEQGLSRCVKNGIREE